MITVPELASEALGNYLFTKLSRRFRSTEAQLTEIVPTVARLSLECIGNSDALYHNVEHTMLVTLVGYDIMKGRALLTHMGKYQARLAADAILGKQVRLRSDGGASPRVIFTDPQVGAVGLTLAAAQAAGLDVRSVEVDTGGNAGGSFIGRGAAGTARLVVDERRGVVVGVTITGPEIAEALHAATIAVVAEVPLEDLWHAVPAFPTVSEVWLRLLEAYGL